MKIFFICGSLEPGRDGVGDYTRRLAGECAARGHECVLLAMHDPHVVFTTDETDGALRLIRLPAVTAWSDRLAQAKSFVERYAPDAVSWQVVPYAFHPRGFLPTALLAHASGLRGTRCHVMFHELWIGLEKGARWVDRGTGWLQRRGVLCLLEQLAPDVIHTSNAAYQQALANHHYPAEVLPLFGNVPIEPPAATDVRKALAPWLPPSTDVVPFVAIVFGTWHAQWRPLTCVQWLLTTARRHQRPPVLLALGRTGAHADSLIEVFRREGVPVVRTGEVEPAALSRVLSAADCGIALHPSALLGKSGTAAAMLEHGLPVLVPRDDWHLRGGSTSAQVAFHNPLLIRLDRLDANRTDTWLVSRRQPQTQLMSVTDDFLKALNPAEIASA